MTTLHLDVEVARQTASQMQSYQEEITQTVQKIHQQVSNLTDSNWQGNSAVEFKGMYDEWQTKVNAEVQLLGELSGKLNAEIANWEAAAAKLGG